MRNLFEHRRGFCLASLYVLFILIFGFIPQAAKLLVFLGLSLLLAVFVLCRKRACLFKKLLITFLIATLALVPPFIYDATCARTERYVQENVPVYLTVSDINYSSENVCFATGTLEEINGQRTHAKVRITCSLAELSPGDVLSGTAFIKKIEREDGIYYLSRGYRYELTLYDAEKVGTKLTPSVWAVKTRARLCSLMSRYVSGENGALLSALFLGEREGLSDGFITDMNCLGTSHMLALSGMHFSILLLGLERILMRARVDKRWRYSLCAVMTVLYLLLTGFPPSAVRAGVMLLFVFIGFFLGKDYDGISALAFSVALICTVQPYSALDGSLWLSAFATFGILLMLERGERSLVHTEKPGLLHEVRRYLATSVKFTLAASIATLPLTACMFGKFPLLFIFANLLFAPLMNFLLLGAIAVLLFGWISAVSFTVSSVADATVYLSSLLASIPNIQITLNHPFVLVSFIFFALLLFLYVGFCPTRMFSRRAPLVLLVCFSLVMGGFYGVRRLANMNALTVSYAATDAENADYFILKESGRTAVIDATLAAKTHFMQIDETLFSLYECEIDAYVFTSYSSSLKNTAQALFEGHRIRSVYFPSPETKEEKELLDQIMPLAEKRRVSLVLYDEGKPLTLGDALFTLHYRTPLGEGIKRSYFSVRYGEHAFAYISSGMLSTLNAERVHGMVRDIDIVFFGAFGSKNSVTFGTLSRFTSSTVYAADRSFIPFRKIDGSRITSTHTFKWKQ